MDQIPDVLVIGGGNAALCAAMTARRAGARVLLLESAPEAERGGNSRHTRNIRYAHERASNHLTGPYGEAELWSDLQHVTGGETDEALARLAIRESRDLGAWMPEHGVQWQAALRGTLHLSRTNAFFLGGGKALINAYYDTAQKLGVEIEYGAEVCGLEIRDGRFLAAHVAGEASSREFRAHAVVAASGGFEANLAWLREYWGDAAANFAVRGTPHNKGRVLRALLDQGARPVGNPREFHAVAVGRAWARLRRRHCDPARQHSLRHRRQQAGAALLRRGRGPLAEALRDLGWADRATARPARVLDRGREAGHPLPAVALPADPRRLTGRAGHRARAAACCSGADGARVQSLRPSRANSTPRGSTTVGRRGSIRRRATGRSRSRCPPSSRIRCDRASRLPTWESR